MMDDYRSKLRSSPRKLPQDSVLQGGGTSDGTDFNFIPSFASPQRNTDMFGSPHKSGYFLRTPSPLRKLHQHYMANSKFSQDGLLGTPSPHKPSSATDLFGNKSLLDNLDVPDDWDETLNNFPDDWLIGLGADDLEGLGKSPLQSPGRGLTFLPTNTESASPSVSPFKSPLLTSSPKRTGLSPHYWGKTPAPSGGRPVTRQRKLFLQSPEKQNTRPFNVASASSWTTTLPFSSMLDSSSSSMLSDGMESVAPLQGITSYLNNYDDDDNVEDMPIMPPAGWTSTKAVRSSDKAGTKSSLKVKRERKILTTATAHQSSQMAGGHGLSLVNNSRPVSGKKIKVEQPQFTLLRPHTELHTHQISLRTAPVTPPNKIKISRDLSQIQTLPSKEQLRIVRNRFTETLNKAVEQVIEREKSKKLSQKSTPTPVTSTPSASVAVVQKLAVPVQAQPCSVPQYLTPMVSGLVPVSTIIKQPAIAMKPPPSKRRKR